MPEFLRQVLERLRSAFFGLPPGRRVAVIVFLAATLSGFMVLLLWSQQPEYEVLFSNLSGQDAAAIVNRLKEQRIPYRLSFGGNTVLVPAERVHETRLALAGEGLPQGGGVGFEIFDRGVLGTTDFVQRMNFLRALQGELARTVSQLGGVQSARVHIALPERTLFLEDRRRPTASVVVSLAPGRTLQKPQVGGIVHLVAASVEGLDPKDVTVLDARGNILAGGREDGRPGAPSAAQIEFKANLENDLEQRVESMLDRVVGKGKSIARVAAVLNLRRVERTEERFNPDSQVARSEQRTTERSEGVTPGGGPPGVLSNQPGEPGRQAQVTQGVQSSQRLRETINYEINKTVERVVEPMGQVQRLSVAVLVDGTYAPGAGGAPQFRPRSPEEIKKIETSVRAAVGFDERRGDQLTVESVPFQVAPEVAAQLELMGAAERQAFIVLLLKYALGGVAVLLLFLFVLRPLLQWMTRVELPPVFAALPQTVGELEAQMAAAELPGAPVAELEAAREAEEMKQMGEQVMDFVRADPGRTAQILREWMRRKA